MSDSTPNTPEQENGGIKTEMQSLLRGFHVVEDAKRDELYDTIVAKLDAALQEGALSEAEVKEYKGILDKIDAERLLSETPAVAQVTEQIKALVAEAGGQGPKNAGDLVAFLKGKAAQAND